MSFFRECIFKALSRASGWSTIRRIHLEKNSECAVCGRKTNLEVHHIKDYSEHPELELDFNNLITLCSGSTKCHFLFGHLGYWKSINPTVVEDAKYFNYKIKNRR